MLDADENLKKKNCFTGWFSFYLIGTNIKLCSDVTCIPPSFVLIFLTSYLIYFNLLVTFVILIEILSMFLYI